MNNEIENYLKHQLGFKKRFTRYSRICWVDNSKFKVHLKIKNDVAYLTIKNLMVDSTEKLDYLIEILKFDLNELKEFRKVEIKGENNRKK